MSDAASMVDCLHSAARAGDVEKLKGLLGAGVDPNARQQGSENENGGALIGYTPLHTVIDAHSTSGASGEIDFDPAQHEGRTACVRLLLEAGASPNARAEPEPADPRVNHLLLHDAALRGLFDISKELINAGADVNARPSGITPIDCAAFAGHVDCVALLLSKGALVNRRCQIHDDNSSALGFAIKSRLVPSPRLLRVVGRLLRAGAEIPLATEEMAALAESDPRRDYLQRVSAAGGFPAYEKQHRAKLVAMLAPKFAHVLPPELVSVVIMFWAPVGLH